MRLELKKSSRLELMREIVEEKVVPGSDEAWAWRRAPGWSWWGLWWRRKWYLEVMRLELEEEP
jgi:hypothetical protein